MSSTGTPRLPHLRATREHAARKIADAIRDFEQLRRTIPARPVHDVQDDLDVQRRHTIELLRSLFAEPAPADEFDHETTRSVFYTNPPEDEQRQDLDHDIRQCITQLRSLTARLDFYQPSEQPPTPEAPPREPHKPQPSQPGPSLILLFFAVLLVTAGLIIWLRQEIAQLAGPAAIVFFLIISLVPAILLFGLFRAVARTTGKLYGLKIELGGPAALFIIVLLILLKVPKPDNGTPPITTTTQTATDTTTAGTTTGTTTTASPPTTTGPPKARWKTIITAHGKPEDNPHGWLDGRYTAYIKDGPNGTITSDPVTTASHAGYVVDTPHQGRYLVTVVYAATTDQPVNIFTAPDVPHENGVDIFGTSKGQLPMTRTPSPVLPQDARVVLSFEAGKNVIDLRAASAAGLPNLFSITVESLSDAE